MLAHNKKTAGATHIAWRRRPCSLEGCAYAATSSASAFASLPAGSSAVLRIR
ncbi:hypothetical protein SAMN06295900_11144 [Trinickia caryophylli]|uniref:Uncharacterized protein n=1 Tax=Trinickia caryophylli TaxID=28094 RepID=A0A1X7FSJ1_TRICW|nr:hypothetical protein SAMN06295900_11144 [Trinickia caryophylli]